VRDQKRSGKPCHAEHLYTLPLLMFKNERGVGLSVAAFGEHYDKYVFQTASFYQRILYVIEFRNASDPTGTHR
jgi:hypothetical protein